jgi:Trypsin-co-occurring domain 2
VATKTKADDQPMLLKDLILQVRQELMEAAAQSTKLGDAPILSLDGVTIEVNFVVETERKLTAGASAKLLAVVGFNAGGEQRYSREQVHKVTVHLSGAKSPPASKSQTAGQFEPVYFEVPETGEPLGPLVFPKPERSPLVPVNFNSIRVRGRLGDEIVSFSLEDILKDAAKAQSGIADAGSEGGYAIDVSDALSRFGRKPK